MHTKNTLKPWKNPRRKDDRSAYGYYNLDF